MSSDFAIPKKVMADISHFIPWGREVEARYCEGFIDRLLGGVRLGGRSGLLVFPKCRSVHTMFGPVPVAIGFLSLRLQQLEWVVPCRGELISRPWAEMVLECFGEFVILGARGSLSIAAQPSPTQEKR